MRMWTLSHLCQKPQRLWSLFAAAFLLAVLLFSTSQPANALPAFARKYGLRCSACHETWPILNNFGLKFRDNGYQSRPTQVHGIDLVTDKPHVVAEHVAAEKFEEVLKPGMVIMAEPNPITADGLFGIFVGHTFIVNETGHEVVDDFALEIAVAG